MVSVNWEELVIASSCGYGRAGSGGCGHGRHL